MDKKERRIMRLLESTLYKADLLRAVENSDLTKLDGKKIFVTGGLGLIGSAIVDVLVTYNKIDKVYVGVRSEKEFQFRFGGCHKVEYVHYDALKKIDLDIKTDYIISGAGLASPELYTEKPVETILSNFDGVHALLNYSKNNGIQRLLYISSSEVYGNKKTVESFMEGDYGEVDIDNIRVGKSGCRLGFHLKFADKSGVGSKLRFQYLDRDQTV